MSTPFSLRESNIRASKYLKAEKASGPIGVEALVGMEHEGEMAKERIGNGRFIDGARARREVTRANSTGMKKTL